MQLITHIEVKTSDTFAHKERTWEFAALKISYSMWSAIISHAGGL